MALTTAEFSSQLLMLEPSPFVCLLSCFSLEATHSPHLPPPVPGVPFSRLSCPAAGQWASATQSQDGLYRGVSACHSCWETRGLSRPFILGSLLQDGTAVVPAERRGPGDGTSCLLGPQGTQPQQQQQCWWWQWWFQWWWRQARDAAQPGP